MIQSIPLKKLVPSPRNVRKSSDVLADLQLRADIAARGLLQNLVVRKGKRGKFEVEAGGRRLSQLQVLLFEHEKGFDSIISTSSIIEGVNTSAQNVVIWKSKLGQTNLKDFT